MPIMIENLIEGHPFAFLMFIPGQWVREAFALLVKIFERQERRVAFTEKQSLEQTPEKLLNKVVSQVPFDFITLVQGTLIRRLGCPIPLIAPAQ
jgi:hypothetical protein